MKNMGERAKQALAQARERSAGLTQAAVAERVGMTPDAFSRALNGGRNFTAGEAATLAEILDADLHWLITGERDPFRPLVAARHAYDQETGKRSVPSREADEVVLRGIELAYRQAYEPAVVDRPPLPADVASVRKSLGEDFVRPFAARLNERLGVDVVRHPTVSTAWSMVLGGVSVVIIPASGNWFRENWSLAHETAHLCLGHPADTSGRADVKERAANAFAAELLLPAERVRAVDWFGVSASDVAELVWSWGISTDALSIRLNFLGIKRPAEVDALLALSTRQLLHVHRGERRSEESRRTAAAARRKFPESLTEIHEQKILAGTLGVDTLAWMLDVDRAALEVQGPEPVPDLSGDQLLALLGD